MSSKINIIMKYVNISKIIRILKLEENMNKKNDKINLLRLLTINIIKNRIFIIGVLEWQTDSV